MLTNEEARQLIEQVALEKEMHWRGYRKIACPSCEGRTPTVNTCPHCKGEGFLWKHKDD